MSGPEHLADNLADNLADAINDFVDDGEKKKICKTCIVYALPLYRLRGAVSKRADRRDCLPGKTWLAYRR
ncbi:MAG: hypothetical protein R6W06_09395 [Prochlorococcaceae cyanobacterium]